MGEGCSYRAVGTRDGSSRCMVGKKDCRLGVLQTGGTMVGGIGVCLKVVWRGVRLRTGIVSAVVWRSRRSRSTATVESQPECGLEI